MASIDAKHTKNGFFFVVEETTTMFKFAVFNLRFEAKQAKGSENALKVKNKHGKSNFFFPVVRSISSERI